jgi:hypothetical protein
MAEPADAITEPGQGMQHEMQFESEPAADVTGTNSSIEDQPDSNHPVADAAEVAATAKTTTVADQVKQDRPSA